MRFAEVAAVIQHSRGVRPQTCQHGSTELLSIVVDGVIELGGGLVESEAVLEDDSLDDIGQQFVSV
jgi:hypothetical protein